VDHEECPPLPRDDDEARERLWQTELERLHASAEELRARALAIIEQELEKATETLQTYARWRGIIGTLKREGIIDEARALLAGRMDLAGDDPLDWLVLLCRDPEDARVHARDRQGKRAKAIRLEAKARLAGLEMGRKRLAREARVPETTVQSWRRQADYQRDIERAVAAHTSGTGPDLRAWVEANETPRVRRR
jgi:hypothetical protein